MDPLILSQEVGVLAGIFFVVAYGLLNFGVLATSSPLYQALNVLGVLGFVYTAVSPFNPGLLITDVVWALVALGFLWRIFTRRKKAPDIMVDTADDTENGTAPGRATTSARGGGDHAG